MLHRRTVVRGWFCNMSEHATAPEALVRLDQRYLAPPFCNPNASHASGLDIVTNFNPAESNNPFLLQAATSAVYENEKAPKPPEANRPKGIDLLHPSSVNGFLHHTFTHAVAGMVRWGASDTRVIPYWDRHSCLVGLYRIDPAGAPEIAAVHDALSINFLRAVTPHLLDRTAEAATNRAVLIQAIAKGQRSKKTVLAEQERELAAMTYDHGVYSINAIAKIKHLLWLVDQQPDAQIRHYLLPEVETLTDTAVRVGIDPAELGVDMGVDTGISADTNRPPYDIRDFRQLRHLGLDTYALPQEHCHQLTLVDMLTSIGRPTHSLPAYEHDNRYHLPFQFAA